MRGAAKSIGRDNPSNGDTDAVAAAYSEGEIVTTVRSLRRRRDDRVSEEKRDVRAADWRAKLGYLLWRALPIDEGTRAFLCKLMGVGAELNPLTGSDDRVPARVALSIAIYRNR